MTGFLRANLLFLFLSLLPACQKKTVPVITERKAELPKKTQFIYPPKPTVPPDTLAGHKLFMARCNRCHGLPDTRQFTTAGWDNILPLMIPRASLNNEEALHIRAWVLANALPK